MRFRALTAALLAVLFAASTALAQAPIVNQAVNVPLGALITNTAQAAATVNGAAQQNLYHRGVMCTFNTTAQTGTPSTTFGIQFYDRASNTYQTYVVSGAITAITTPTTVVVYPGIQTTSLPTGMVAISAKLGRQWRVFEIVAGTSPVVTGTVGCELLVKNMPRHAPANNNENTESLVG